MQEFHNAHVFVVDSDSYPVHRDRLFCGVKNPKKISYKWGKQFRDQMSSES